MVHGFSGDRRNGYSNQRIGKLHHNGLKPFQPESLEVRQPSPKFEISIFSEGGGACNLLTDGENPKPSL